MKLSFPVVIIAVLATVSCGQKQKQSAAVNDKKDTSRVVENKIMIPVSTCYSSTNGRDSVYLKVEVFENVVTGKLSYNLYEKDRNTGDFEGQLHGDTLLADYTFMSEGQESVRQVAFLLKDSEATEGYGDVEEKNGKMVFKNQDAIIFGKGLVLKNIPCVD